MWNRQPATRWLGGLLLAALSGCAGAYHAYPCGGVPYDYCPDPPLPYSIFSGCPTPIAVRHARPPEPTPVPAVPNQSPG